MIKQNVNGIVHHKSDHKSSVLPTADCNTRDPLGLLNKLPKIQKRRTDSWTSFTKTGRDFHITIYNTRLTQSQNLLRFRVFSCSVIFLLAVYCYTPCDAHNSTMSTALDICTGIQSYASLFPWSDIIIFSEGRGVLQDIIILQLTIQFINTILENALWTRLIWPT